MVALLNPPITNQQEFAVIRGYDTELTHRIDSKTFRQVANLHVVQESGRVTLHGRSKSYYVKQLATHAVLELLPGANIENAIDVT